MKRWIALCLLACACGSSSGNSPDAGPTTGSGTLTGTVNGQALTVRDAVFGITPYTDNVNVVVGDRTGLCALLTGSTIPGPTTVFGFGLLNLTTAGNPVAVGLGDYSYADLAHLPPLTSPGSGQWWDGAFAVATTCTPTGTYATAGKVTVTQVGSTTTNLKVTLTNITFPNGSLNGSIEAIYCDALKTQSPPCGAIPP
ncbi:MAG TPA: hypothetical protein VMT11_14755 [Myxococcaceae bacterium]|nr:hypothetical protein [Myxococcaceae bacterium]